MDQTLNKSLKITAGLVLAVILITAALGNFLWGAGFLLGNLWAITNFYFMVSFLKITASRGNKARLFAILLLKFPLLYFIGFLLFKSRFFPDLSLLVGLVPFLAITGIVKNVRGTKRGSSS